MSELQPMEPEKAVEMYLETRRSDTPDATVQKHRYRLQKFLEWCKQADITDTTELGGRMMHKFRLWRKEDGDLAKVSLRSQLNTIRTFIRFCENVDAVEQGLHEKIELPDVSPEESSRDKTLDPEQAEKIATFLQQYRYAPLSRHSLKKREIVEALWNMAERRSEVSQSPYGVWLLLCDGYNASGNLKLYEVKTALTHFGYGDFRESQWFKNQIERYES